MDILLLVPSVCQVQDLLSDVLFIHTCIHLYTHIYIYIYIYTHTNAHIYLYKYIYISWGHRDDSLKALNLLSMEDAIKLSTQMKVLSHLSWYFSVIKHCHAEGGHYWLASWISLVWFLFGASSESQWKRV